MSLSKEKLIQCQVLLKSITNTPRRERQTSLRPTSATLTFIHTTLDSSKLFDNEANSLSLPLSEKWFIIGRFKLNLLHAEDISDIFTASINIFKLINNQHVVLCEEEQITLHLHKCLYRGTHPDSLCLTFIKPLVQFFCFWLWFSSSLMTCICLYLFRKILRRFDHLPSIFFCVWECNPSLVIDNVCYIDTTWRDHRQ